MQDDLMESARYRFIDAEGRWSLVSLPEAKRLKLRCKTGGQTDRQTDRDFDVFVVLALIDLGNHKLTHRLIQCKA